MTLVLVVPSANADELDPVVEQHLDGVAQYYASRTGTANLGCNADCEALNADLGRPPTAANDPIPAGWRKADLQPPDGSLVTSPLPVKLPPYWLPSATGATRVVLGVTVGGTLIYVNLRVWKIVIDDLHEEFFVGIPEAAYSAPTITTWDWSDGTGQCCVSFRTYFDLPKPIPFGFVARGGYNNNAIVWETHSGASRCPSGSSPLSAPWVEEFAWVWNRCWEGYDEAGHDRYTMATAHGLREKTEFLFPPIDGNASPDSPSVTHGTVQSLTQAQILQRLRQLLTSGDPDYDELEAWINSVLGGGRPNPRDSASRPRLAREWRPRPARVACVTPGSPGRSRPKCSAQTTL